MQKFQNNGTFKFKDFRGLGIFFQNSRTSQGPYEPQKSTRNTQTKYNSIKQTTQNKAKQN